MHTVLCGRDSQHRSNAAFTDTLRRQQVFSRNGDIQRLPANTAPATQHPPTNHIRPLLRSPLRHLRYYACPTLHPDILLFPPHFPRRPQCPFGCPTSCLYVLFIHYQYIIYFYHYFCYLGQNFQRVLPAHSAHRTAGSTYSIEHGQFTNFKL